jgi:hypothetical protein
MALKTSEDIKSIGTNKLIHGHVFDDKTPNDKKLVYEINKDKKIITFYPYSKYLFFDKITINGFIQLPEILQKKGFSRNNLLDYISRTFKDKSIKSVTINRTGSTSVIKRGKDKHLHLSYRFLSRLSDEVGSMNFLHKNRRSKLVNKYFNSVLPKIVKIKKSKTSQDEIKNAIQTLTAQTADSFNIEDIDRITEFLSLLMREGHKSQISKSKLFRKTKLKIDTITFDAVIEEFEKNLQKKVNEAKWGQFLENNIFLIDSKYIYTLKQLNVELGGTRKVDFGLVDTQGYLDLFEIKKPETKLLSATKNSRGNYVWSNEAIEAIVQAEKYLYHAERKGSSLKEDIKREREIDLEIIRPRAYVIIGNSDQLDNSSKKEDFRILKNQFKNIEIILYDELLDRIKNQKKSIE